MQTNKKRVFSGIRATGRIHLGNYLGAVKGMLELQDRPDLETVFMVADVHTITTPYEIEELRQNRREVILDYLSAGLDPNKSIIAMQSMVPEHTELAFYFSSVMSIARMQHLPTFKDKIKQYPDHATMALLNYPILMAADILVYKAGLVPVGIDQEPHLEVAREVARKMNEQYGTDFPEPKRFATRGEYVPSLRGEGKMSKSVGGSFITLTDDLTMIEKRIAGLPTDSGKGTIEHDKAGRNESKAIYRDCSGTESVGVSNLMTFVELFQGKAQREIYEKDYESIGLRYGQIKSDLARAIFAQIQPLQEKRKQLEADTKFVNEVIEQGAARAQNLASNTLMEVKEKMGLG